ncbi:MAG: hypothetical protein JWL72_2356 [Ilumatobacteraceae bacterium]|nr:hypothetical protein [Ilumatobacteraceae bacterium]
MKLVYVFDAYCGWSYGFAPTMTELVRRHPELDVEVISGGLFTGDRRVPIRDFGYVQGANAKITELTGVTFGTGYERIIADGSFVMDSEDAARGIAALRHVAPDRIVELAAALQQAFYADGLSLSDPDTYRAVAEAAGLEADRVVAEFAATASTASARKDFTRAAALDVHSFPTLIAINGQRRLPVAVGHATADEIDRRLDALADAS